MKKNIVVLTIIIFVVIITGVLIFQKMTEDVVRDNFNMGIEKHPDIERAVEVVKSGKKIALSSLTLKERYRDYPETKNYLAVRAFTVNDWMNISLTHSIESLDGVKCPAISHPPGTSIRKNETKVLPIKLKWEDGDESVCEYTMIVKADGKDYSKESFTLDIAPKGWFN